MRYVRQVLKTVLILSLLAYAASFAPKLSLPDPASVLPEMFNSQPIQEAVATNPISFGIKKYTYTLTPHYSYDLYGLVVSLYDPDNPVDITHKDDPGNIKDICVVWGKNITNGSYRALDFSSGEFTCFWRWSGYIPPPFQNSFVSNNHLIPQTQEIARLIKDVQIGDQIHIKGLLTDYEVSSQNGSKLYERHTSTTRDDTGNGACEVIYVTGVEILKRGSHLSLLLSRFGFWGAAVSLLTLAWIFFTGLRAEARRMMKKQSGQDKT